MRVIFSLRTTPAATATMCTLSLCIAWCMGCALDDSLKDHDFVAQSGRNVLADDAYYIDVDFEIGPFAVAQCEHGNSNIYAYALTLKQNGVTIRRTETPYRPTASRPPRFETITGQYGSTFDQCYDSVGPTNKFPSFIVTAQELRDTNMSFELAVYRQGDSETYSVSHALSMEEADDLIHGMGVRIESERSGQPLQPVIVANVFAIHVKHYPGFTPEENASIDYMTMIREVELTQDSYRSACGAGLPCFVAVVSQREGTRVSRIVQVGPDAKAVWDGSDVIDVNSDVLPFRRSSETTAYSIYVGRSFKREDFSDPTSRSLLCSVDNAALVTDHNGVVHQLSGCNNGIVSAVRISNMVFQTPAARIPRSAKSIARSRDGK